MLELSEQNIFMSSRNLYGWKYSICLINFQLVLFMDR